MSNKLWSQLGSKGKPSINTTPVSLIVTRPFRIISIAIFITLSHIFADCSCMPDPCGCFTHAFILKETYQSYRKSAHVRSLKRLGVIMPGRKVEWWNIKCLPSIMAYGTASISINLGVIDGFRACRYTRKHATNPTQILRTTCQPRCGRGKGIWKNKISLWSITIVNFARVLPIHRVRCAFIRALYRKCHSGKPLCDVSLTQAELFICLWNN